MEKLATIVNGTTALRVHVCNGKVFYQIQTGNHLYQLGWKNLAAQRRRFFDPFFSSSK